MGAVTAIVDGHVHIHACYNPDAFFDTAHRNLNNASGVDAGRSTAEFLLMTECAGDEYFRALHDLGHGQNGRSLPLKRWKVSPTAEAESIEVSVGGHRLFVVAGCQIACQEGLEVLMIGTTRRLPDRQPIRWILSEAATLGVPHVVPWGTGKWFFQRGRLLSDLLKTHHSPLFFLGDEGGRPGFWPYPKHFREALGHGVRDLPGTDPLPFPHDMAKVGLMGFLVDIDLDESRPARSLLNALGDPQRPLQRFATLEPPLRFVRNQIAMQLRKRRSA